MAQVLAQHEPPSSPSVSAPAAAALDRDIWAMAWPAMLSLMLVNVVDLIDVALVGRLGREAIAAYGYAAQYVHLVNMLIQSVGIGCVALVARAIGARERASAERVLCASLVVAQTIAWLSTFVVALAAGGLLGLLRAGPDVIATGSTYFRVTIASTLLYSAAFMFESVLRAHRITRTPMLITAVVTAVKTAGNYVFIYGALGAPALGLTGAAVATVCAHGVGLALYLYVIRTAAREGEVTAFRPRELLRGVAELRQVLRIAAPAMAERAVMSAALLTYFAILSRFGTAAIAAYAIGVRLLAFSWVPGLGFSTAASTFVGQALGAANPAEARRVGWRAVRLAVALMAGLGVVCLVARGPLSRVFTSDAEVIEELLPFLLMLALSLPAMGVHFTLSGVLRGAGDTVTPFVGAAVGNWVFRVPLAWLFASALGLPITWVWAVLVLDHLTRMVVNGAVFLRGRWARRVGVSPSPPPEEAGAPPSS